MVYIYARNAIIRLNIMKHVKLYNVNLHIVISMYCMLFVRKITGMDLKKKVN